MAKKGKPVFPKRKPPPPLPLRPEPPNKSDMRLRPERHTKAADTAGKPKMPRRRRSLPELFAIQQRKYDRGQLLKQWYADRLNGRPSDYMGPVHDEMVFDLRRAGCTREQMAIALGLTSDAVFQNWLATYPSFAQRWHEAGDLAKAKLMKKMWQLAEGYKHDAVKIHVSPSGDVTKVHYTEHYPPNFPAASFIITNMEPKRWKNRTANEVTGADGEPLQIPQMTILPVAARPPEEFDTPTPEPEEESDE